MFTYMIHVTKCQNSGDFVKLKYPKCNSQKLSSIDDGICENEINKIQKLGADTMVEIAKSLMKNILTAKQSIHLTLVMIIVIALIHTIRKLANV